MEAISVKLDTRPSLLLPGRQESIVIPLGDIQLDPPRKGQPRRAHLRRLTETIEWGVANGAYFIGMGDYVDVMSPSNRAVIRSARLYDTVRDTLDQQAEETQEELHELLAATRGRWLGLVEGHHFYPYDDGDTTDTRLAAYLGCPFLGTSATIVARQEVEGHRRQPVFKFDVWHGEGSGQTAAAPLNRLERRVGEREADVYLMGHYHRRAAVPKPRLDTIGGERGGTPEVVHRDRWLVSTGSFMRAYLQGSRGEGRAQGSYVEKAGLPPAGLGAMAVFIRPRIQGEGYVMVDISVLAL